MLFSGYPPVSSSVAGKSRREIVQWFANELNLYLVRGFPSRGFKSQKKLDVKTALGSSNKCPGGSSRFGSEKCPSFPPHFTGRLVALSPVPPQYQCPPSRASGARTLKICWAAQSRPLTRFDATSFITNPIERGQKLPLPSGELT